MRKPLALLFVASAAHAGGLGRPNGVSARGAGMAGAFTAWADDPTAIYFNPAALDTVEPQVMVGGEYVYGPRRYTPVADDGTRGPDQEASIQAPLPTAGVAGRFWYDDHPSRFTLGAGVWNTFGGNIRFPTTGQPALDKTQDAVIEAAAGASVRISDKLAFGGAFRIGYGLFSIDATMDPYNAHLSASGIGVAMAWGALVRPTETVRIGVTWRSPLRISTSGSGTVEVVPGNPTRAPVAHDQLWPQQVSLGVGWQATPALKLAAQLDWTEWSMVHSLVVAFPTGAEPDQVYPENWNDNWAVRLGGEYAVSSAIALRAGTYLDTAAVPDRTIERQYLDSNKIGVSAGAGYAIGGWRIDAAIDAVIPTLRTVPNNTAATMAFPADRNKAPGDYIGTLITFDLAASRRF